MSAEEPLRIVFRGKIVSNDKDKRVMMVRDTELDYPVDYLLKWEPVMDDVCSKEKVGNRVQVDTTIDLTAENPQPVIKSIRFDEHFRKDDTAGNEILLQSCLRTGAAVLEFTTVHKTLDFAAAMDLLMTRAVKDAKTIKKESKKL